MTPIKKTFATDCVAAMRTDPTALGIVCFTSPLDDDPISSELQLA